MIAIDTNVLVRIIVEDAGQIEQTKVARELAKNAHLVFIICPLRIRAKRDWVYNPVPNPS